MSRIQQLGNYNYFMNPSGAYLTGVFQACVKIAYWAERPDPSCAGGERLGRRHPLPAISPGHHRLKLAKQPKPVRTYRSLVIPVF